MNISQCTLQDNLVNSLHFLHIPKTAGTSLRSWLLDLYREEDWLPCHFLKDLEKIAITDITVLQKYRFFSGHLGISWYDFLPAPPFTFTWLRQPVKREISQYFYIKNMKDKLLDLPLNPFSRDYINAVSQLSLAELCRSPYHKYYYDNLQVRSLAGVFPKNIQHPIVCDDEMSELAKKNLLSLTFFGITEYMNISIFLFNYCFGFPPRDLNLTLNTSNKNNHRNLLEEKELEIIKEANFYDLQLYDFALNIFHERIHNFSQKTNLFIELSQDNFVTNNQDIRTFLLSNFQEKQRLVPRLKNIKFDFSEAVFLEGWYPRFFYEPIKKWLRWSGPATTSYIYLPLAENIKYKIVFKVFYSMSWDILTSLSLCVNETDISLNLQESVDEQLGITIYEFTGIIPSHIIGSSPYCELKFATCSTLPLEINHEDRVEVQYVSFAIDGLSITAI